MPFASTEIEGSEANRAETEGVVRSGILHHHRVELVPITQIAPYSGNARTHSRKQVRLIADSIRRFGFNNPVLLDDGGGIIAGHGRLAAAKLLGFDAVPALRLSHLSATEKRAYILADNRLAEKAGWDREILSIELQGLIDLDFDVEVTGFETGEIDIILDDADQAKDEAAGPDDRVPEPLPGLAISQPGDVWVMGTHRLLCGDARDSGAYEQLLGGEKAEFVITDPPYNVKIDGYVCGKGTIRHREFAMASGEMTQEAFTGFLVAVFRHLAAHTTDGSIHDIFMDGRHMPEMMAAGNEVYTELKNLCVWNKTNAGMGTFYRSQHELVFIWKSGTGPHINNFANLATADNYAPPLAQSTFGSKRARRSHRGSGTSADHDRGFSRRLGAGSGPAVHGMAWRR
jgi:hypothetical protein